MKSVIFTSSVKCGYVGKVNTSTFDAFSSNNSFCKLWL